MSPPLALHQLLAEAGERIAKRWARGAAAESGDRVEAGPRELKRVFQQYVDELVRLLEARGMEAPALWGESVRHHGGWLVENGFSASDLVRQFHALVHAIAQEWARRHGEPPPTDLLALVGEVAASGAAAAAEDYLRRVRAGRARVREEGAIDSIVAHLDEGLLAFESDGTLSFATPAAARILGVPESELTGLSPVDLPRLARRLHLSDGDDPLGVRETLKTRRPARGMTRRLVRPSDGEERIVELSALPVMENGEIRGVVETLLDRTAEVKQRRALEEAYEELRRLHLRLLRRSRAQAAGELAGRIGVSIMNALNAARLRCRLLHDAGAPAEHVHAIERSIDELAEVMGTLQGLSAPREAGEPEVVDLDAAVGAAVELIRPELSGPNGPRLALEVELTSHGLVRARRGDVRELVLHLLLAALDHASPGAALRLSTAQRGGLAHIVLAGAGGLETDLAPARELAATWAGQLRRQDDAIIVELPAVDRAAEVETQAPPSPPIAPAPAQSVLVVDDDGDNRHALAAVLEAQGFEVAQAASPAEAEAQAHARPFQAALVDLVMPDGSGWDVVRRLRELQPDTRVALVTGAGASISSEPGAGVDVVFAKPVDLEALLGFLGRGARASVPGHGPGRDG